VRPLAALRGLAKYEIVAGERRWLATEKAGQAHILARIIELDDQQVLKAQLVENLHREKLDTLAEAQGYRELIDSGVNADAIAAMIGLSRSYVYARVKLLSLCDAVKEALAKGEIDASQALLFARIPTEKLQEQGLNTLRKWAYQGHGERLSFRRTAEILSDKGKGFLIPLATVPFSLEDESYFTFGPKRGAQQMQDMEPLPSCAACPKRSGNDAELLAALGDANVCTDKACHDAKAKQEFERRRKAAEASGQAVLAGDAAAALLPTAYGTRGYIDLDDECDDDRFPENEPEQGADESDEAFEVRFSDWDERAGKWQPRTYRQILGDLVKDLDIQLVQDPKHRSRLRELAPDKDVARLLKEKGIKARIQRDTRKAEPAPKPKDPEAARRQEEREAAERAAAALEEQIEQATQGRVLKAAFDKWKGPLKRDELELLAEFVIDNNGMPESVEALYQKVSPATMNERDLGRFLVLFVVGLQLDWRDNDRPLKAMTKQLKIDPKAIAKAVRAELDPKAKAAPVKKASGKGKRK
jgi:ParB/RepB/Spo0J family partition protein